MGGLNSVYAVPKRLETLNTFQITITSSGRFVVITLNSFHIHLRLHSHNYFLVVVNDSCKFTMNGRLDISFVAKQFIDYRSKVRKRKSIGTKLLNDLEVFLENILKQCEIDFKHNEHEYMTSYLRILNYFAEYNLLSEDLKPRHFRLLVNYSKFTDTRISLAALTGLKFWCDNQWICGKNTFTVLEIVEFYIPLSSIVMPNSAKSVKKANHILTCVMCVASLGEYDAIPPSNIQLPLQLYDYCRSYGDLSVHLESIRGIGASSKYLPRERIEDILNDFERTQAKLLFRTSLNGNTSSVKFISWAVGEMFKTHVIPKAFIAKGLEIIISTMKCRDRILIISKINSINRILIDETVLRILTSHQIDSLVQALGSFGNYSTIKVSAQVSEAIRAIEISKGPISELSKHGIVDSKCDESQPSVYVVDLADDVAFSKASQTDVPSSKNRDEMTALEGFRNNKIQLLSDMVQSESPRHHIARYEQIDDSTSAPIHYSKDHIESLIVSLINSARDTVTNVDSNLQFSIIKITSYFKQKSSLSLSSSNEILLTLLNILSNAFSLDNLLEEIRFHISYCIGYCIYNCLESVDMLKFASTFNEAAVFMNSYAFHPKWKFDAIDGLCYFYLASTESWDMIHDIHFSILNALEHCDDWFYCDMYGKEPDECRTAELSVRLNAAHDLIMIRLSKNQISKTRLWNDDNNDLNVEVIYTENPQKKNNKRKRQQTPIEA